MFARWLLVLILISLGWGCGDRENTKQVAPTPAGAPEPEVPEPPSQLPTRYYRLKLGTPPSCIVHLYEDGTVYATPWVGGLFDEPEWFGKWSSTGTQNDPGVRLDFYGTSNQRKKRPGTPPEKPRARMHTSVTNEGLRITSFEGKPREFRVPFRRGLLEVAGDLSYSTQRDMGAERLHEYFGK